MTLTAHSEMQFELEWTKRKLDGAVATGTKLVHENDQLRGMVEQVIDQFSHYSVGDLWTQDDMMIIRDLRQQLEVMD